MYWIGIDPGVHTGFAVWDDKTQALRDVKTFPIHTALEMVKFWWERHPGDVKVIYEDAWQRTWYTGDVDAKKQGAGSVKRDCTIWKDFCEDLGIPYWAHPPQKGMTKCDSNWFQMVTGWKGRTSNHSRDAAMLVLGK